MASHKASTYKSARAVRGFTLIEVLVVMGLIVFVAGFGLIVSMESYRGYSFRTERDTFIGALEKARSEAINNMCYGTCASGGQPHGIHFGTHQYVVFQGETYATRDSAYDEVIQARYLGMTASTTVSNFTDVVFSRLAGTTTPNPASNTLTLMDIAGKDSTVITVNPEGQISWTN